VDEFTDLEVADSARGPSLGRAKLATRNWRQDISFISPAAEFPPRATSAKMVSMVLVVFLVQLAIHIVNTLGSAAFSEWVCDLTSLRNGR
jgi:hypothetical protein